MATLHWLDEYFGPQAVNDEGTELPRRRALDIVGPNLTATDDPIGDRTILTGIETVVGWRTAIDIDFTAADDPGVNVNGTYEIGGIAGWQRENAVNDREPMTLSSSGLTIQPNPSIYDLTTRSAPLLWLPLSALAIPLLDWDTGFRVWIHVSAETQDTDFGDCVFCGIDSDSLAWCPGFAVSGSDGAGGRILASGYRINGAQGGMASTSGGGNPVTYPTGVLRADIPKLASPIMAPTTFWSSISAPWSPPSDPSLRPMATYPAFVDSASDRMAFANASELGPGSGLGIVLGAWAGDNSDHYVVTITRLRVDYRL